MYTDGVAEASDPKNQLFGTERMLEVLNSNPNASPREALDAIMDRIESFSAGAEQFDDITMMCFRYLG